MADLASYARALSPREAARLLIYRPRCSTETVFTGIQRFTERATAIFGGHLHAHYPEPATASRGVLGRHGQARRCGGQRFLW
ncbi:hypothetical protein [Streptomyces sp. NPDC050504]|uniref:hypothetical protein n=1 Tax=Streptomyces sp. NPDC050504 TaxID=3365618 RepID=UPI0037A01FD3